MPSRTPTNKPFAAATPPSKAELMAYLEGRLSPERAHAVEHSMEEDPFLREAMEGLAMPGAIGALAELERPVPTAQGGGGGRPTWFLIGAVVGMGIVAGVWLAVPYFNKQNAPMIADAEAQPTSAIPSPRYDEATAMDPAEISAAVEQPETLRIGHIAAERPLPNATQELSVVREPGPLPLDPLRPELPATKPSANKPVRAARSSRVLLFPYDLKLVHPEELYPYEPSVSLEPHSVSAAYPDRQTEQRNTEQQRNMVYTVYMEQALGQFNSADHRACLKSLNFLLEQYPNDVNALFYAGLCSYNLALYDRARQFFHRAATHPVDSFYEEATWYHALTLDRLGELDAAQEAYARIAAEQGFYAKRATERIR